MNRRTGFTLIELLAVIAIIAILASLAMVAVIHFIRQGRRETTRALILTLGNVCKGYCIDWGDYPPSDLQDMGAAGLNDLNNGIEALVACLASGKRAKAAHKEEKYIANVDDDSARSNITKWYFEDNQLREITDVWGHPLVYFHHRDYEGKNPRVLKYKFSRDSEAVEVRPRKNPATGTFVGHGSFQMWSVGEDGKPGTDDDIDVSQ